jgi:hypothetical protein
MTDDRPTVWPPALFGQSLQEATEEAVESQRELFEQFVSNGSSGSSFPVDPGMATFKTRVQSGGRISIPDAEREALDIQEGDIVQAVVVPIKRDRGDSDE